MAVLTVFIAASLVRTGQGMALVGLLLGAGCFVTTRPGSRRASGPYGRGQDSAAKVMAVPLLVIGVVGLLLWAVGAVRG